MDSIKKSHNHVSQIKTKKPFSTAQINKDKTIFANSIAKTHIWEKYHKSNTNIHNIYFVMHNPIQHKRCCGNNPILYIIAPSISILS